MARVARSSVRPSVHSSLYTALCLGALVICKLVHNSFVCSAVDPPAFFFLFHYIFLATIFFSSNSTNSPASPASSSRCPHVLETRRSLASFVCIFFFFFSFLGFLGGRWVWTGNRLKANKMKWAQSTNCKYFLFPSFIFLFFFFVHCFFFVSLLHQGPL